MSLLSSPDFCARGAKKGVAAANLMYSLYKEFYETGYPTTAGEWTRGAPRAFFHKRIKWSPCKKLLLFKKNILIIKRCSPTDSFE